MDKLLQTNDEQEHKEKIRNTIKMNNRKKRKRNKGKTKKKNGILTLKEWRKEGMKLHQ